MGIANESSLATSVAKYLKAEGAELGLSYQPDKPGRDWNIQRVKTATEGMSPLFTLPCDVTDDASLKYFFSEVGGEMGAIDFLVHSIAYAPPEDLKHTTLDASREGFHVAMDVSCYSLIACAREAAALMPSGGAIGTLTFFGGEKVVGGYNLMGVCKAALDMAVRYLAYDLAPRNIRVNAVSAGPVKTQSLGVFGDLSDHVKAISPQGRSITGDDVARAMGFLLSPLASATTGELMHVDGGYHFMGSPGYAFERLGFKIKEPS
jgi:enoyl-[acyl-carrier protein] reductase I